MGIKKLPAGRPSHETKKEVKDALGVLEKEWLRSLQTGIVKRQGWAMRLFADYYYGKPKEVKDVNINVEQPVFQLPTEDIDVIE